MKLDPVHFVVCLDMLQYSLWEMPGLGKLTLTLIVPSLVSPLTPPLPLSAVITTDASTKWNSVYFICIWVWLLIVGSHFLIPIRVA